MNNSAKLQPIAKVRKQQERNAGRQHGDTLRLLEQQQRQLEELITYRMQYEKTFQLACQKGLSAIQMQEYKLFICRLDEAIMQQQKRLSEVQNTCETSRKEWLSTRNKSKMLNKVVESRQQSERLQRDKREQREIEDRPHNISNS